MCLLPAALKKQAEEQNNTELPDKTRNVVTEKKWRWDYFRDCCIRIKFSINEELEKRPQFVGQFVSKTIKKSHFGHKFFFGFRVDGRRGLLSPTLRTCPFDIWIGRYGITVGFDTECSKSSIARDAFLDIPFFVKSIQNLSLERIQNPKLGWLGSCTKVVYSSFRDSDASMLLAESWVSLICSVKIVMSCLLRSFLICPLVEK